MAKRTRKRTRTPGTSVRKPPTMGTIDPRIPGTIPGIPPTLKPRSELQIGQTAATNAAAQVKPQLDALNQNQKMYESAHAGRTTDIGNWGQMTQTNLSKAFENTRDALNQLIGVQGGVDRDSQAALVSALNAGGSRNAELAAQLGVTDPSQAATQGAIASGAASGKSAEQAIGQSAGGLLGQMGAATAMAPTLVNQLGGQENERFNAQLQDLATKRSDIAASVPGLVSQNLQDLRQFELAKGQFGEQRANDLYQQFLGDKQFKLTSQNQTFQQWLAAAGLRSQTHTANRQTSIQQQQADTQERLARHTIHIDWENARINRIQANAAMAAVRKDADQAKTDNAKQRADAWNNALTWLATYMTPGPGEPQPTRSQFPYGAAGGVLYDKNGQPLTQDGPIDPNTGQPTKQPVKATKPYQRLFDDALRGLQQHGMDKKDALRILSMSEYSDWVSKATAMLAGKSWQKKPAGLGKRPTHVLKKQ